MSDLRKIINLIESKTLNEDETPTEFDSIQYFRHLKSMIRQLEVAKSVLEKDDLSKEIFALVRTGKQAADSMPGAHKRKMLADINKVLSFAKLQAPVSSSEPDKAKKSEKPEEKSTQDDTKPKFNVAADRGVAGEPDSATPAPKSADHGTWRMINLSYKDDGITRKVLGISENNGQYHVFGGKIGEQYAVSPAMTANEAKNKFFAALKNGYKEISPGAYSAIRNGAAA